MWYSTNHFDVYGGNDPVFDVCGGGDHIAVGNNEFGYGPNSMDTFTDEAQDKTSEEAAGSYLNLGNTYCNIMPPADGRR